jgi:pimeloyl-ACP methyl ester carboxylesterase
MKPNKLQFRTLSVLLGCCALYWQPATAAEHGNPTQGIELSQCELTLAGTNLSAPAECGGLEVPENPAQPNGRKIRLNIARVPAQGRVAEPDPLFVFAGGPGQAATESWLIVAGALRKVNEDRDIILIDQRGTGQSNALKCPQIELKEALSADWDDLEAQTRQCLDSLDGDPRFYTTTIGMQDYDRVRAALGYEQINLFGVSYGTRAAQVYLRNFPDRVRTMVLDSVVPQDLALGTEHAIKLDQAIFRVLEACDLDDDCHSNFPGSAEKLRTLMRRLAEQPVGVTVPHPNTGAPFSLTFDRTVLAFALRFLTYGADTQAMLPLLVHEAATKNDFDRLASQMLITAAGLQDAISQGMELSVICSEDFPLFPAADAVPEDAQSLMGNLMLKSSGIQCAIWPSGDVPDNFHDPVESAVPALLLSGELDPVTPPEYADRVMAHLSDSRHLVAPGQGHSVTGRGCLGDLVSEFIISGSSAELDTDCIENIKASPFFVSLTGPKP